MAVSAVWHRVWKAIGHNERGDRIILITHKNVWQGWAYLGGAIWSNIYNYNTSTAFLICSRYRMPLLLNISKHILNKIKQTSRQTMHHGLFIEQDIRWDKKHTHCLKFNRSLDHWKKHIFNLQIRNHLVNILDNIFIYIQSRENIY